MPKIHCKRKTLCTILPKTAIKIIMINTNILRLTTLIPIFFIIGKELSKAITENMASGPNGTLNSLTDDKNRSPASIPNNITNHIDKISVANNTRLNDSGIKLNRTSRLFA